MLFRRCLQWLHLITFNAGTFVKVFVIDRGHGLADDAEERLFTPFLYHKPDDMGAGLTVCHSIIQSHGGRLTFQRYPEGGTIFEFTMPIAD